MAHALYIRDRDTFREADNQDVLDRAAALIAERFRPGAPVLDHPEQTRQYLCHQIGALPYEVFGVLLLDARRRLLRSEILFRGTVSGVAVHPREVARVVVEADAACVILFRSDPTGVAEPRDADEVTARRIADLLTLVDTRVLDYIIVGGTRTFSFAEAERL